MMSATTKRHSLLDIGIEHSPSPGRQSIVSSYHQNSRSSSCFHHPVAVVPCHRLRAQLALQHNIDLARDTEVCFISAPLSPSWPGRKERVCLWGQVHTWPSYARDSRPPLPFSDSIVQWSRGPQEVGLKSFQKVVGLSTFFDFLWRW